MRGNTGTAPAADAPTDLVVAQALPDTAVAPADEPAERSANPPAWQTNLDAAMGRVNGAVSSVFFFDMLWWNPDRTLPLVVGWLAFAAIFLVVAALTFEFVLEE